MERCSSKMDVNGSDKCRVMVFMDRDQDKVHKETGCTSCNEKRQMLGK